MGYVIAVVRDLLDYSGRILERLRSLLGTSPMNRKLHMVFRGILILILIAVIVWKFGLFR